MKSPLSTRFALYAVLGVVIACLGVALPAAPPAEASTYAAVAPLQSNDGFWSVSRDGIVTASGAAPFFGDLRGQRLNAPIMGMATTPGDRGYWLVASDGGVFSFGSAKFFGSTGSLTLNKPIVGMTPTRNGSGYWMVATDGGIFSFGSAQFLGSTGAITLNQPIVGMASTSSDRGYWMVAADGGVFTFGDAPFRGAALDGRAPVYGLTPDGLGGYTVLRTDGSMVRRKGDAAVATPTPSITIPAMPQTPVPVTTPPVTSPPVPVTSPPVTSPPTTVAPAAGNVFANRSIWVDPSNPARGQASAWASSRPADAELMTRMGNTAAAAWIGDWTGDVTGTVSGIVNAGKNANAVPVMVAYNIPGRDCGQWSAGGASHAADYRNWIDRFAAGLGAGPSAVILEPDALPQLDCLDSTSKANRLELLRYAVTTLSAKSGTSVYIDAGHPGWHSAQETASRLQAAGIANARGFSLNVSNYKTTAENTAYGLDVSNQLSNKPFVIDTSRNGNGSNGEWCNPSGRALGALPTANTGNSRIDALLWLKRPGESDGNCNGGPSAGVWWPDYALGLARSAWS